MKMQRSLLSNVALCVVLVMLTSHHQVKGKIVEIIRAEQDRFTNIANCSLVVNAGCFDTYCTYCQCGVNQTFVQTRGLYGECVANDLLVYATAHEASFLIQNNHNKLCLYQRFVKYTRFVRASSSLCQTDDRSSRWLWTNDDQLVNMATLECITDNYATTRGYLLTMKKCDKYNQKQSWKCVGDKKYEILRTTSGRYMYFGDYSWYVTTKTTEPHFVQKWKRYNTGKDICSKAVGCDVFADGSSLLILNRTKCKQRSECLGQKQIDLSKSSCVLLANKTQYLHNDTWKPLQIVNGIGSFVVSASEYKVFLKWELNKTPKSWAGLLVKAHFECEDMAQTIKTEHCAVIKYMGTFSGFGNDDDDEAEGGEDGDDNDGDDGNDNEGDDGDDNDSDDDKDNGGEDGGNGDGNKDKGKSHVDSDQNSKDNTKIIVIVVCVLLVLLLSAGVIAFIIFRRRNRLSRSEKCNTGKQGNKKRVPSEGQYEESRNPLYPANNNLKSAETECELYESTSNHVYQYVDPKNAGVPTQNPTYDYASPDVTVNNHQQSSEEHDPVKERGTPENTDYVEVIQQDGHEQKEETKDRTASTKPPHKYHVLKDQVE